MNLDKTGKLIAKLRKEKHLTQSKLGEMLGISDRSVSKWERGISFPNVSLINDLSNILGIDPSVLLAGKTPEEYTASIEAISTTEESHSKKHHKLLFIIPIIIIIIIFSILYFYKEPKDGVYTIYTNSSEYQINGSITLDSNIITLDINSIHIFDKELDSIEVTNYEYNIYTNNYFLFQYGNIETEKSLNNTMKVNDLMSDFRLLFKDELNYSKSDIVKSTITLRMTFETIDNNIVTKELLFKIKK